MIWKTIAAVLALACLAPAFAAQAAEKPNIVVIWGDDIGRTNLSVYSKGMMGYYNNWKVHFMEQDQPGTLEVWQRELRGLRLPLMFNLRTDPFEQATITSNTYWDWTLDHAWILYPLPDVVGRFLGTFEDFPPRHAAASFTVGDAMEILEQGPAGSGKSAAVGPRRVAARAPALAAARERRIGSGSREDRHA